MHFKWNNIFRYKAIIVKLNKLLIKYFNQFTPLMWGFSTYILSVLFKFVLQRRSAKIAHI